VALDVRSRLAGDVTVVTCHGRIVEGGESAPLARALDAVINSPEPYIVLSLEGVNFIDSGGLGLLLRFVNRIRAARGRLTLCAVPAKVSDVLRMTRLQDVFEAYNTEGEAIAASYEPAASDTRPDRSSTDILCVDASVDVQSYVRELLAREGYGVLTAGNLPDALALLQATQPRVVVIGADLRAVRGTETAERFNTLAVTRSVVELPRAFSSHDAGDAGAELLARIRAVAGAR
jgi:anti-sigma B factor antagonist